MNYLKIKNFGPVKDATIELKPFLVLIGGQGTGKSTIAKLLSIFQDYLWYVYILENKKDITLPFFLFGILEYFHDDTYLEYKKNDVHLEYKHSKFSITSSKYTTSESFCTFLKKCIFDEHKRLMLDLNLDVSESLEDFFEKGNNLLNTINRSLLYIPAERNFASQFSRGLASIIMTGVPIPTITMNYLSYFEKSRKYFTTYDVPVLNLKYRYTEKEEGIIVNKNGKQESLSLEYCSSGIQSLLPMLMILDYCLDKNIFDGFVIEEPEQNLFPDNQLATLRHIISKRNHSKSTCIITTHSPYLLSGINISLMAGQVARYKVYKDEVCNILPAEYHLTPGRVTAYALGDTDNYCKDIINPQTGTIDQNYLDTTSTVIGQEFGKLYKLYIKTLKG